MSDCTNPLMKDLLPDLLHDRLTFVVRADVQAHVDACADCRAEFDLLVQVHAVAIDARVDASRIASALPPYRRVPAWRRVVQAPQFRMAAAIILLLGGAGIVENFGYFDSQESRNRNAQTPSASNPQVAVSPSPAGGEGGGTSSAVHRVSAGPAELGVGETLHDLTDSELRTLLDELGSLDTVTPNETEVVVPAVSRGTS